MQLNIPGIAGIGSLPATSVYRKIGKDGGEDKQLTKVAADKSIKANIAYVEKKIDAAKDVDDLLKDRKVMQFILSAFSLESELDKSMGIIKKVLTQDPADKKSLANRLADPRYLQMAKALNFYTNGLTKLKEETASQSSYNLSLSGNNYFIVQDTVKDTLVNRYLQSSSFKEDSKGYLSGPADLPLLGWSLDTNGGRPAASDEFNTYSTGKLVPVKINALDNHYSPTSKITADVNLKSTIDPSTPGPHFVDFVNVYDTSGTARQLSFEYTKNDTGGASNEWTLKVFASGNNTPLNGADGTTLTFNADGTLADADAAASGIQQGIKLDDVHFFGNFGDSHFDIDLSSVRSTTTDSYALAMKTDSVKLGKHTKVDIDKSGYVTVSYEGGQHIKMYQLATASFGSPASLLPGVDAKKDLLSAGASSGSATVRVPGVTGGSINNDAKVASSKTLMDSLKESYYRNEYEVAVGKESNPLREALYFKRMAANVKDVYGVLGDKVMRDVVTTAFDLPSQLAVQSVEAQAQVINRRLDVKKLSDPAFVDKLINQYLAKTDAENAAQVSGANSWQLGLLGGNGGGIDYSLLGKMVNTSV